MKNLQESKATLYFDTRRALSDGSYPIKLRIYHNGKERPIPTGYSCPQEHWIYGNVENDEYLKSVERGEIKFVSSKYPNSKRTNNKLANKLSIANNFLEDNSRELANHSVDEMRDFVKEKLNDPEIEIKDIGKKNSTLTEGFKSKMDELKKGEDWGNFDIYADALEVWEDFLQRDQFKDDVEIVNIDKSLLYNFVQFCKSSKRGRKRKGKKREGMAPNSINIYLRCLRHIIKRAISDPNETMNLLIYPFTDFKWPKNETLKRATDADNLDQLRIQPVLKGTPEWDHRNYWLFMFNNQGMNLIDLAFLKRGQIEGNRLKYARTKTRGKAVFDIELTEESIEILKAYNYQNQSPDELVFPFMKDVYGKLDSRKLYKTYKNRIGDHNKYMKKLASMANIEVNITSYVARHTWASIGFEEFESLDAVGQGLGHQSDPKVTKKYAKDLKKKRMDEINKTVTKRKSKIITVSQE